LLPKSFVFELFTTGFDLRYTATMTPEDKNWRDYADFFHMRISCG